MVPTATVIAVLSVARLSREAIFATYAGQDGNKQGYPAGCFIAYFGSPSPAPQPKLTAAEVEQLRESLSTSAVLLP